MFNKILIANRGEIAVRIIKTAKKLGIHTVAVYSEADKNSLFVKIADESYLVGPAEALQSYLNIEKIIKIAKSANVDAIHPGYGFLSENADFADSCEKAKIKFIGPSSKVIIDMGSKAKAKSIMSKANVPLIPGYLGDKQDKTTLLQEANKIGYPLLIKASMGGGGKGMRVVKAETEFSTSLDSCKREAKVAFGDDHVILEKYIKSPRHIEVQIFGDDHGNAIHLFERDCSIQRRHQKVIEEAPSSIKPAVRKKLGEAATNAAKALNYTNAGTIEFLMDDDENFYFMEMNTRLQVEHPVTEMITNLDLVELQIKVALGEKLPVKQEDIELNGHAIEARIYAEDPANDFLPTTGKILKHYYPNLNESVRLDSGIQDGDDIGIYYDPMLAKLIVKSDTRFNAISKLKKSLSETHFVGLNTNIPFLRIIAANENFVMGNTSTHFLEKVDCKEYLDSELAFNLTACAYFISFAKSNTKNSSSLVLDNWRMNVNKSNSVSLIYKSEEYKCSVQVINDDELLVSANGANLSIKFNLITNNNFSLTVNDKTYNVLLYIFDNLVYSSIDSYDFHFKFPTTEFYSEEHNIDKSSLTAPMPGTITKLLVKQGEKVTENQPLLIMEAMKMEHTINSPSKGLVKELHYNLGETVEEGVVLLALDIE